MDPLKKFQQQRATNIERLAEAQDIKELSEQWLAKAYQYRYPYNFDWLGIPIIQYPQDIVAVQELIWNIKPDLIIETGVAHGGSAIFYASMLQLLNNNGKVVGIDNNLREHNLEILKQHPLFEKLILIEGDSTDQKTFEKIKTIAQNYSKVLVCLDSLMTHEHVLKELELYSQLVTPGSYLVVFDTFIEELPEHLFAKRPWGKNNNPETAIKAFLNNHKNFIIDTSYTDKLLLSSNKSGYLKKLSK